MMGDFCFKYLPKEEFERIVLKVQQSRQDKEDEWRWQQYVAHINKTTSDGDKADNEVTTTLSSNNESSDSEQTLPSNRGKPTTKQSTNFPRIKDIHNIEGPSKKIITPIEQHAKTREAIIKAQLGIQGLLASIGVQMDHISVLKSDEEEKDSGSMSPKAVKLRCVRLAEFNARFRRNYIYPLQVEIDKTNELLARQLLAGSPAPNNANHQLALRALDKAHTRAFQALQIFQRQSSVLKELLKTPQLLDDLISHMFQLSELSSCLGLPNEELDNRRRSLSKQIAEHNLHEDMIRLGLCTPRITKKEQTKKAPLTKAQASSTKSSGYGGNPAARGHPNRKLINKSRPRPARARTQTWTKVSQPTQEAHSSECVSDEVIVAELSEQTIPKKQMTTACPPVNVQVVMMHHEPVSVDKKVEVNEVSTQTTSLASRGVGTDVPTLNSPSSPSSDDLQPDLPNLASSNSFTGKLQRAVLSELAGQTDHLGPLIDQLLREEFL